MLTSGTLTLLATMGEKYLEINPSVTPAAENAMRIVIAEAKDAARAANGMSTRATFMLSITLNNNRKWSSDIRGMVDATAPDYGDISENNTPSTIGRLVEEANALADANLADALRTYIWDLCDTDSISEPSNTLVKIGLSDVDWHALARYYREP